MDNKTRKPEITALSIVIIFIVGLWIWSNYRRMNELRNVIYDQEEIILNYQEALSDANDNIEDANAMIEDAKWNAWGNYYEMGEALEELETVDTIPEP